MGFKVRKPILRATSRDTLCYVSAEDGALYVNECDFDSYVATLDESHLAYNEGAEPARFEFKPLTRAQWKQAQRKATVNATNADGELSALAFRSVLAEECFRRGVERVTGITVVDGEGREKVKALTAREALEMLDESVLFEVGLVVVMKTDGALAPERAADVPKS